MPVKSSRATKNIVKKIKDEDEFTRNDCDEKDYKDNGPRKRVNKKA